MYDELVERLRNEADCPDNYPEDSDLMREAADAIEELVRKEKFHAFLLYLARYRAQAVPSEPPEEE